MCALSVTEVAERNSCRMKRKRPTTIYAIRTHLEVAKALGLSRRQVQETEWKALRKLRRALGVDFLEGGR